MRLFRLPGGYVQHELPGGRFRYGQSERELHLNGTTGSKDVYEWDLNECMRYDLRIVRF